MSQHTMSAYEVADALGVHVQTVWRWVREHTDDTPSPVPFVRLGRSVKFPRARVEAMVTGEQQQPSAS
jgi:excisionase family DNA binding protein